MAKGKRNTEEPAEPKRSGDPNLPRPDGDQVSQKGGLVFLVVILGLVGVAVAAQFLTGQ
ncbi:MAG: hypothetical protein ACODAU_10295 [Myxococcota bacterium]